MQWINVILWSLIEAISMGWLLFKSTLFKEDDLQEENKDYKRRICVGIFVLVAAVLGWVSFDSVQSIFDCIKILTVYVIFSLAMMSDIKLYVIPNIFVIVMLIVRVVLLALEFLTRRDMFADLVKDSLIGGVICLIVLLLVSLISKGGLGMGDVKLLTAQGVMIGLYGVINTLMYALVCCSIFALVMLATNKKKLKDKLPFAPFIFAGFVVSILLGGY